MKEEIRKRLQAAIDKRSKSDADQEKSLATRESERAEFEDQWAAKVQAVVIPALEEMDEEMLKPAGWTVKIEPAVEEKGRKQVGVKFIVYKGDMRGMGGADTRPELTFRSDRAASQIWVNMATASQTGADGNFKLEDVTADLVQEKALKFVERLAG